MRTSFVFYIAPSAISVIPNCNGSADDISVSIAQGTKIKVYSPNANIGMVGDTFQEWTLTGRNRRLTSSDAPYTIFARLAKRDKQDGYLVFAEKTMLGWEKLDDQSFAEVYVDRYSSVSMDTDDGLSVLYKDNGFDVTRSDDKYWYVRLGDVSKPVNGERTLTLDTGILGTDRFNTEWELNPDELPLRVELACAIGGKEVGNVPYVAFGQSAILAANLIEGWNIDGNERVHHWIIARNTGNDEADDQWNFPPSDEPQDEEQDGEQEPEPRLMPSGRITLNHVRESDDDFGGAVAATFTVTALAEAGTDRSVPEITELYDDPGDAASSGSDDGEEDTDKPSYVILAAAKMTMLAEAIVSYGLDASSRNMVYNPVTGTYFPAAGIVIRIYTCALGGMISYLSDEHIAAAKLHIYYGVIGDDGAVAGKQELPVSGGQVVLPPSLFQDAKNLYVWLENEAQQQLAYTTIDYMAYSGSIMKSMMFVRLNDTPEKPVAGSFANPSPSEQIAGIIDGTAYYWEDGIPAGDMQIWCSMRVFTSDGKEPQESEWSKPQKMSDQSDYDVEFAKKQPGDVMPDKPSKNNRHGGSGEQIWFDPELDSKEVDFTQMYWRAECKLRNGAKSEWVIVRIKGEKGDDGISGDTPLNVYAWNQDAAIAPKIADATDPTPDGWSPTPTDRPGDGYYLWMSTTMLHADGSISGWSSPVRISGDKGMAGEDAKSREWIYRLDSPEGYDNTTGTAKGEPVSGQKDDVSICRTVDDFIPTGWNDNPAGVSKEHPTEYATWREFNRGTGLWGDFHEPITWSHYGRNGMDGDGMEYVFIRTKTDDGVVVYDSGGKDSNGRGPADDDYLPAVSGGDTVEQNGYASRSEHSGVADDTIGECTDEPKGVDAKWPYEWVIRRTKGQPDTEGQRAWQQYSGAMALWATYSESITKSRETRTYQVSDNGVDTPSGEWQASRQEAINAYNRTHDIAGTAWVKNTWLWTRVVITWSDGSDTTLYSQERNPDDGVDGQDVYIVSQRIDYAVSASNAAPPSSGWDSYATIRSQMTAGKWLWTRTTVTFSSGDPQVSYSTSYIARDGATLGENLIDNSEQAETFNVATASNSDGHLLFVTSKTYVPAIIPPDGTKVSGQMRMTLDGCSLGSSSQAWLYFQTAGTEDTVIEPIVRFDIKENGTFDIQSAGVATVGANGGTWDGKVMLRLDYVGPQGSVTIERVKLEIGEQCTAWSLSEHDKQGRSIAEMTEHYQASDSYTGISTPDDGDWPTNPQPDEWGKDAKYLWSYEKIVYNNGDVERTPASVVALWTMDGRGVDSITNYYLATSYKTGVTRKSGVWGTWTTGIQSIDEDKPYLWNYEKVTYTEQDGTRTEEYTTPHIIGHYGKDGKDGEDGVTPEIWSIRTSMDLVTFHRDDRGSVVEGTQYVVVKIVENVGTSTTMTAQAAHDNYGVSTRFSYIGQPQDMEDEIDYLEYESSGIPVSADKRNVYIAIFDTNGAVLATKTVGVTADGPLGPAGDDGKDAYGVSVSPEYAIFEQRLQDDGRTVAVDVSQWVGTVSVNKDGAAQSFRITEWHAQNCDLDTATSTAEGTMVTTAYVKFAAIHTVTRTDGEITHHSEGYLQLKIKTVDEQFSQTVKIPFYVNLLGAFMRTVNNGVETAVGELREYLVDSKSGSVIRSENLLTQITSATENITTIEHYLDGGNILPRTGWQNAFHELLGTENYNEEDAYILADANTAQGAPKCVFTPDISLAANTSYILSFYATRGRSFYYTYYQAGSAPADYRSGWVNIAVSQVADESMTYKGETYRRYYATIGTGVAAHAVFGFYAGDDYTEWKLLRPQLEVRADSNIPSAWSPLAYNSQSVVKQTAEEIELKVNNTGIDIDNETINLTAGKVNFISPTGTNDKVKIDPETGTLHAVNGDFSGNGTFRGTVYASEGEFKGKVTATSGSFSGSHNGFEIKLDADNRIFAVKGPIGVKGLNDMTPSNGAKTVEYLRLGQMLTTGDYYYNGVERGYFLYPTIVLREYHSNNQGDSYYQTSINGYGISISLVENGASTKYFNFGPSGAYLPYTLSITDYEYLPTSRDATPPGGIYRDGETLKIRID